MVTLQQLQRSLHGYIKYLIEHPNTSIEVRYKGSAYQLHLDPIDIDVPARINKKIELDVKPDKCQFCKGLMINNVCISNCKRSAAG